MFHLADALASGHDDGHVIINRGRFGSVFMCKEKQSGRDFAAKFIKIKMGQREELRNEVMIMNELHHPKLLLLWDAFEAKREMVLVMEQ